jgi:hypothetical protein
LQEGPQTWYNSSSRGARVELLLQVGVSHLCFLVKFHDLIYFDVKCEITECMCIQGEKLLCELPNDEIITEKGKY